MENPANTHKVSLQLKQLATLEKISSEELTEIKCDIEKKKSDLPTLI
jgi:hypothetical protein